MVDQTQENVDVFAAADQSPAPQDATQHATQLPTELTSLIGEGKKYNSVEEALKSVPHAQSHIQKLEQELEALRQVVGEQTEELKKRATAEEMISQMNQRNQPSQATPEPVDLQAVMRAAAEAGAKAAQDANVKAVHDSNQNTVMATMREKYGDKAPEVIAAKAAELDVDVNFLRQQARTNPKMYWKLIGDEPKGTAPVKTTGRDISSIENTPQNISLEKPKKSVLYGASSAEVINEWRRCAELVKQGD